MQPITLNPICLSLVSLLLFSCSLSGEKKPAKKKTSVVLHAPISEAGSIAEFEQRVYLKISELHTGKEYTNKLGQTVFYRVLVVPEEENIMLLAENIQVNGEEGGDLQLAKIVRITDDNSALPKFGLVSADSLQFIDSVNIQGYFNHQKKIINLDKLKPYRVSH